MTLEEAVQRLKDPEDPYNKDLMALRTVLLRLFADQPPVGKGQSSKKSRKTKKK